jgi:hypothetical protein
MALSRIIAPKRLQEHNVISNALILTSIEDEVKSQPQSCARFMSESVMCSALQRRWVEEEKRETEQDRASKHYKFCLLIT